MTKSNFITIPFVKCTKTEFRDDVTGDAKWS